MDDVLKDLEAAINGAGETPRTKKKEDKVTKSTEKSTDANTADTGYHLVEQSLPDSDHKLLGRWVHRYNLSDDDPMFGEYLAAKVTFSSAAAAGRAIEVINANIQKIPEMIFEGARAAGYDINLEFKKRFEGYGQTLIVAVDQARDKAKSQIQQTIVNTGNSAISGIEQAGQSVKDSTKNLETMLSAVIEQKAKEGLQQWADAARVAGQDAARGASARIYQKASIIMIASLAACFFGGGGVVYWIGIEKLNDHLAPLPIMQASGGKPDCFIWNGVGGEGGAYCRLIGTKKELSALPSVG